jgi:hypothetical protein
MAAAGGKARADGSQFGDWEGIGSLECVSVGFLLAENEPTKTLIPHFAYANDDANRQGSGQTMHRHTAVLIRS